MREDNVIKKLIADRFKNKRLRRRFHGRWRNFIRALMTMRELRMAQTHTLTIDRDGW